MPIGEFGQLHHHANSEGPQSLAESQKYAILFLLCWQLLSTAREGAKRRDEESKVNPGVLEDWNLLCFYSRGCHGGEYLLTYRP